MEASFFKQNRAKLAEKTKGGLVIIAGNKLMQRKNDMAFGFEQEANFWYISGVEQPDCTIIYDGTRHKTWLIVPEVTEVQKMFEGNIDESALMAIAGADEVVAASNLDDLLRHLRRSHAVVYTLTPIAAHGETMVQNPAQRELVATLNRLFHSVIDCRKELSQLRSIKTEAEVKLIKKVVQLTTKAFEKVHTKLNDYTHEYSIEADFIYEFRKNNAGFAYDPIVARGKNACTLHYSDNNNRLQKNKMILIDIGAEADGYSADITRTYCKGQPAQRTKILHDALQAAHQDIISIIKPGMLLSEYQKSVDSIMQKMLVAVGLIKNESDPLYRKYFPHAISHGLGIDVHDSLGGSRTFEPGMVITVEPGVYVSAEGIGIRIEDNILITKTGANNLSASLSTGY